MLEQQQAWLKYDYILMNPGNVIWLMSCNIFMNNIRVTFNKHWATLSVCTSMQWYSFTCTLFVPVLKIEVLSLIYSLSADLEQCFPHGCVYISFYPRGGWLHLPRIIGLVLCLSLASFLLSSKSVLLVKSVHCAMVSIKVSLKWHSVLCSFIVIILESLLAQFNCSYTWIM